MAAEHLVGGRLVLEVEQDPNGLVSASKGSLAVEVPGGAPKLWQNTDGIAAWSEVSGGGGGAAGSGSKLLQFNSRQRVPGSGTRYLRIGEVATSSAPQILLRAGVLTGASLAVNAADASRTFDLEILLNGVVEETTTLALSTLKVVDLTYTKSYVSKDEIAVRLVRASGSGQSTFRWITALLELQDT